MLRKIAILAALAACVLAAAGSSAPAATYIHGGTTTGNLLPVGTGFRSNLRPGTNAVITTSIGTITCASGNLAGTTRSASGGSVVSGVLDNGYHGLELWDCTDTVPLINYGECEQTGAAPVYSTAYGATGGTFDATSVELTCDLNTGGTCTFDAASVNGTFSNSGSSATYTGVPLTGSGTFCPSSGTLSMTFAPVGVTTGSFAGRNIIINTTP